MQRVFTKELIIYIVIFVILGLIMHPDLLDNFSSRFSTMIERKNFFHPLVYTFIVYFFVIFFRFIAKNVVLLINKFRNK